MPHFVQQSFSQVPESSALCSSWNAYSLSSWQAMQSVPTGPVREASASFLLPLPLCQRTEE